MRRVAVVALVVALVALALLAPAPAHAAAAAAKKAGVRSPVHVGEGFKQQVGLDEAKPGKQQHDDDEDNDDDEDDERQQQQQQKEPMHLEALAQAVLQTSLDPYDFAAVLYVDDDCEPCAQFEGVLAEAYALLPRDRVLIGKFDCTGADAFCKHDRLVPRVPQIYVYKHGQYVGLFNASMTGDDAQKYILGHLAANPEFVEKPGKPRSWTKLPGAGAILIAVETRADPLLGQLHEALDLLRDTAPAYALVGADVARVFDVAGPLPRVLVYNKNEQTSYEYSGPPTYDALHPFVVGHTLPLLDTLNSRTAFRYAHSGLAVVGLLVDDMPAFKDDYEHSIKEVLREFRGRVTALIFDVERDERLRQHYAVASVPTAVIETRAMRVYRLEDAAPGKPFNADTLRVFIQKYLDGTLPHRRRSEEVPDEAIRGLTLFNTYSFESVVHNIDRKQDVLILFFVMDSPQCQQYAPVIGTIARALEGVESVIIGAMNLEHNELPTDYDGIRALPLLAWYPRGEASPQWITKTDQPTKMPTLDELAAFVREHASEPLTEDDFNMNFEEAEDYEEAMRVRAEQEQQERTGQTLLREPPPTVPATRPPAKGATHDEL